MHKEFSEYINQMAFGKLPIIQLVSVEKMTFPLYDWEAARFKKWQDEVWENPDKFEEWAKKQKENIDKMKSQLGVDNESKD